MQGVSGGFEKCSSLNIFILRSRYTLYDLYNKYGGENPNKDNKKRGV